jgi:photosystem II stability/assembly factor-like uncharacterized protein
MSLSMRPKCLSVALVLIALLGSAAMPVTAFGVLDRPSASGLRPAAVAEWSAHAISEEGGAIRVSFVDTTDGWVGDPFDGYLFHTTDGGLTWTRSRMPQSTTATWRWGGVDQIQFVDRMNGWVLMGGEYRSKGYWWSASRLYRTTDGGATWTRLWTRKTQIEEFQFVNASRGWFVIGRTVYRTTDGGATLTNQYADKAIPAPKKSSHLWGLRFVDAKNGWACGSYLGGSTKSILLRTKDGGKTWRLAKTGLAGGVMDVWFADSSVGYAIANGLNWSGLYRTTNAGKSWRRVKYSKQEHYDLVQAFGSTGIRLLGFKPRVSPGPSNATDVVWTSRDGGATWPSVDLDTAITNVTSVGASSMSFVDMDTGWIAGAWLRDPESGDPYHRWCILRTPFVGDGVVTPLIRQ